MDSLVERRLRDERVNERRFTMKVLKWYCIVATREIEGDYVFHKQFDHNPTREEILKAIETEDCGYDDRYGKFRYFGIEKS